MESKAKFLGHPIHQMLIVFPLGLLIMATVFDIIGMNTDEGNWSGMSFYMIGAGVITGLGAAIFGLIDWLAIPPRTRAKAIGLWHGAGNGIVLLLFAASWLRRRTLPEEPERIALALSFTAVAITLVSAWLGSELVDRLGVGVDDGANLDAPSSLSGQSALKSQPTSDARAIH